uniref:striatin-4 n=1 Tax=Lonchura striata TaxID=40157 RepID=UPI001293F8AC|nr:striatin-4 [Lonchura striata domestica]
MAAERAPPARAQPPPPGPAAGPAPAPAAGPEPAARTGLSLPGILHFIQHEWARFEAEKGRWEAERAELQAQVAFLQGERQGQESLKLDLVRRIRMLEFALKQERCKLQKLKLGPGEKRPEEPLSNGPVELEGAWRDGRRLLRQNAGKEPSPPPPEEDSDEEEPEGPSTPGDTLGTPGDIRESHRCHLRDGDLGPPRPPEGLPAEPLALDGLGDLAELTVTNDNDGGDVPCGRPRRSWSPRLTLRSHFDAVRALAFVPCHPALVTASEDATLKLWDLQKPLGPKKSAALDVEPVYAFRGHRGPVLAVAVAPGDTGDSGDTGLCCSAGVDARIRCWRLPGLDSDPYDGYDPRVLRALLEGHADAVWGLAWDGGRAQVNQVLAHPWQPLTITASDDGAIRYLDNRTGSVVHSVVAHLDAVTCLALDSSGSVLMSGSE